MNNALRRIMRLDDWVFAFALPTCEGEFAAGKASSDFCYVPPPLLKWSDYYSSVAVHFEHHIVPLERLGLTIVRYPTVSGFTRRLTNQRGVVLFTHCALQKRLEFRNGLIPLQEVARRVDNKFAGICEICACAPIGLEGILKARAPNAIFKVSSVELSLRLWMIYYSMLFTTFGDSPCDFRTASLRAQAFVARM